MENNLEIGFDQDDNEIEVSKYGKKQIIKKKFPYITFILVITFIIFLFITNIYQFYLINIKNNENKYLKEELNKIRLEKSNINIILDNKEKEINLLKEKYNEEKNKNYEFKVNNNIDLNKKIIDLESDKRVLELENQKNKETINLLKKEKEELFNSYQQFKEETDQKYKSIVEQYPSLELDKDYTTITVHETEMTDTNMIKDAGRAAVNAIENSKNPSKIASSIKNFFEDKYKSHWGCIVGYDFGGSISAEKERAILFNSGNYKILLFQCPSSN